MEYYGVVGRPMRFLTVYDRSTMRQVGDDGGRSSVDGDDGFGSWSGPEISNPPVRSACVRSCGHNDRSAREVTFQGAEI
jgi:hypothetical protein